MYILYMNIYVIYVIYIDKYMYLLVHGAEVLVNKGLVLVVFGAVEGDEGGVGGGR